MCCAGLCVCLWPSFSYTGSFWEVQFSQFGDAPISVDRVTADSPAHDSGLRSGDRIVQPGRFDDLQREFSQLRPGEKLELIIRHDETESTLDIVGSKPHLAAVWYAHWWSPIAGAIFFVLCLLVFGTAPLQPAPAWRSAFVAGAAFVIAVGCVVAGVVESPFTRISIWQAWLMGNGKDWTFGQEYIVTIIGVALAIIAMMELRTRLDTTSQPLPTNSQDK